MKTFELEQLKATREAREVEIAALEEQEKWSNFVQSKVEELNTAENEVGFHSTFLIIMTLKIFLYIHY